MEKKEAIEVIKKNWPDSSFTRLREALETLIPELKESEDESENEKIRKTLIHIVRGACDKYGIKYQGKEINEEKLIDWLEKQGNNINCIYDKELSKLLHKVICRYVGDPNISYIERENVSKKIFPYVELLEKQSENKPKKVSIWKHWKNGIAGNGEGKQIYLIKIGNTYNLSSCLSFECDYIELSELDNLMLEKQDETMEINPTEFDTRLQALIGKFDSLPKEELIGSLSFWLNVVQNDGTYKDEKSKCKQKLVEKYNITGIGSKNAQGKLGEMIKNLKPADKVEPKFHEGEWIIRSAEGFKHNTYLVKEVKDYYACEDLKGQRVTFTLNDVHKNFKLWDISDAKDGDILAVEPIDDYPSPFIAIYKERGLDYFNSYCFIGFDAKFYTGDTGHDVTGIHPATKEQRDTLEKAMADAEYEWSDKDRKKVVLKLVEDLFMNTNKIDLIKEEVERLKSQLLRGACSSQIAMETRCKEEAYNEVLAILDTLQEEPVSDV